VKHRERVAVTHRACHYARVRARRLELAESRLARREMQKHQPAGCIVDVRQQRALRRARLEPAMLAAIDSLSSLSHKGARGYRPRAGAAGAAVPPR
jgi:hypothetical protein